MLGQADKDGTREASPVTVALGHANTLELAHTLVGCNKDALTETVGVIDGIPENVLSSDAEGDADSVEVSRESALALVEVEAQGVIDTTAEGVADALVSGAWLELAVG